MSSLFHRTVCENDGCGFRLPLVESLRQYHNNGAFHLVENPKETKQATIVGMFVLRPSRDSWTSPLDSLTDCAFSEVKNGWSYNFEGLEGGWLLANGNPLDAFRLALQYGISDAVIVSSKTVADEGCDTVQCDGTLREGYLWQPYGPCSWNSLSSLDSDLYDKIMEQRSFLQRAGVISQRRYPAQVFVTYSGLQYPGANDILNGKHLIF